MKLLIVLLVVSPLLACAKEEIDGSGEDVGVEMKETTTAEPEPNTASIGSFVVEEVPGQRRICTCFEFQKCNFDNKNTQIRDQCAQQCSNYLSPINNNTLALTECFNEHYLQELEISDKCIRSYHQDLCSNFASTKKVADDNWGLKQFDASMLNPLYKSNVFMIKAEMMYTAIRNHQRCTTNCMRKEEYECRRTKLNCSAKLPTTDQLEETLSECVEYSQNGLSNARAACKCMARKGVTKLVGLCSLFIDAVFQRV